MRRGRGHSFLPVITFNLPLTHTHDTHVDRHEGADFFVLSFVALDEEPQSRLLIFTCGQNEAL